ncbi:MAG TPA: amidohydrolase family protein [Acidimicrobiales bacterium]|nr:amidohydrolase family protein [Acidimicrobiales bacterium]
MSRSYPVISADSHITEPPNTYTDHIDPKWRDKAPRMIDGGEGVGDMFVVEGSKVPIPMGLVAAAGKDPSELRTGGAKFEDLHRGGWDPEARLGEQERDGVAAEIIYPTVGMVLCNIDDLDLKKASFDAYNRWIAEYCSAHPDRLLGCGQTAMRTPAEGIDDLKAIKALGLRGVMMPGNPGVEDYDSPVYDEFWETAIELGLPLSFHILTTRGEKARGPKISSFLSIVRGCQDIMAMLVFGGVFERHPDLKVVCVEADAGWVPHFMYRMDHAFNRHRYWLKPGAELSRLPSEYFAENIFVTFQDDWTAFRFADAMNWRRLLWANDFPHSDSTWPWSQELLEKHTAQLSEEQTRAILCDNVAGLYGIDLGALAPA